jgi:hypothetical protein
MSKSQPETVFSPAADKAGRGLAKIKPKEDEVREFRQALSHSCNKNDFGTSSNPILKIKILQLICDRSLPKGP